MISNKRKKRKEKKKNINVSDIIKNHLEKDSKNSESVNYIIKNTDGFISEIEAFLDMEYSEEEEEIDWKLLKIIMVKNIDCSKKSKHFQNVREIGTVDSFLLCACARNDIVMVKKLVNLDQLDINQYSLSNGDSALIMAIKNKNTKIAKLLIENPKTNINQRNFYNEKALSIAVHNKLFEIVIILLIDKRFYPDENLIKYVYYISNYDLRKFILSYILHKDVKNNYVNLIDAIIQNQLFDNNSIDIKDIILAIKLKSFNIFQNL